MGYNIHDIGRKFGRPEFEKQFEEPDAQGDWGPTQLSDPLRDGDAEIGAGGDWPQGPQYQGDPGMTNVPAGDVLQPAREDPSDRATEVPTDSSDSQPSVGQLSENFS